jgi:hypothetical protein
MFESPHRWSADAFPANADRTLNTMSNEDDIIRQHSEEFFARRPEWVSCPNTSSSACFFVGVREFHSSKTPAAIANQFGFNSELKLEDLTLAKSRRHCHAYVQNFQAVDMRNHAITTPLQR